MSYSPLSTLASIGFMKNTGLDLSFVTNITNSYNANPIVSDFKTCVTLAEAIDTALGSSANGPSVSSIGGEILPGLLGSMPSTAVGDLGSGTLADTALEQAQTIFPGGDISSFVQNFGKSSGAASMGNDLLNAAKKFMGKGFTEMGGGVTKISDIATGGFGNLSKVAGVGLAELGAQLKKAGDSVNIQDVVAQSTDLLNNSVATAKNLIERGAGDIGGLTQKVQGIMGSALGTGGAASQGLNALTANAGTLTAVVGVAGSLANRFGAGVDTTELTSGATGIIAEAQGALAGAGGISGISARVQDALGSVPAIAQQAQTQLVGALDQFKDNQFASEKIKGVLDGISNPADLSKLKDTLNLDADVDLNSAADLLDPTIAVPALDNFLNTEVLSNIKDLVSGVPGGENLQSFSDLGDLLQGLQDVPASDKLDALANFINPDDFDDLLNEFPDMDDVEAGLQTSDMIGIVSGGAVGDLLKEASSAIKKLEGTAEYNSVAVLVAALKADLLAAPTDPFYPQDYTLVPLPGSGMSITDHKDAIEAAMTSIVTSGNNLLQDQVAKLSGGFSVAATKLASQVGGLDKMGIDLTQVQAGNKMALIGFGRSLGDFAKNPDNEEILTRLCGDSEIGEAIRVHIVEKKNIEIFSKFGITLPNILR